MTSPRFFEGFEVGMSQEYGDYLVTKEEILEFALNFDPQPFHLSERGGEGNGLWRALCIWFSYQRDSDADDSGQYAYWGDRLRMKNTIINKKESRSRPDIGTVFMYNEIFNQNGEMVTSFKLIVMFKKKQSADIFLSN